MEWIKCSDRLPPKEEPVLIFLHNRKKTLLGKYNYFENEERGKYAEWFEIELDLVLPYFYGHEAHFENDEFLLEDVSHWAKLPDPPKN